MDKNSLSADASRLKAKLAVAANRREVDEARVRQLVCALVEEMKADRAPPEKVLIAIKMAFIGGTTTRAGGFAEAQNNRELFFAEVVELAIRQYYHGHTSANPR